MNFLSHYKTDGSQNHQQNFGLLLPDFLGIVNRKLKMHHLLEGARETEVVKGIKLHLRADDYWHSSKFFIQKNELIKKVLIDFDFVEKPYRPFFMTHVILELLLDRALVLQNETLCHNMYGSIEKFERSWLNYLNIDGATVDKLENFVESFIKYRYVFQYANNEQYIYALNRLFQRVRHPELEFTSENELNIFVTALDSTIQNDYENIFHEIRNQPI
ncbi:MAG: hypothetical protein KDC92_05285 [Bacteroidetes bacterium]|nr:hypothetical protein [Bacteroidota bacterium]